MVWLNGKASPSLFSYLASSGFLVSEEQTLAHVFLRHRKRLGHNYYSADIRPSRIGPREPLPSERFDPHDWRHQDHSLDHEAIEECPASL